MKRFSAMLSALCLLLTCSLAGCQKAPDAEVQTTMMPIQSVEEIPLETLLYLFIDMTDLGLDRMIRTQITPEDIGSILGKSDFEASFAEGMRLTPTMQPTTFEFAVFRLDPDQDAAAFAEQLEENAVLNKWVCTSAQLANTLVSDRIVVFYMCNSKTDTVLQKTFKTICTPGFRPDDHLRYPLKHRSAREIYDTLLDVYPAEMYGFMDGTDLGTSAKGLPDGLTLPKELAKSEICWDITEEAPATSSLVMILKGQSTDEESAKQTAQALYDAAKTVNLPLATTQPGFSVGYHAEYGVYILYAATGNWKYYTWDINMTLQNSLRMTCLDIPE